MWLHPIAQRDPIDIVSSDIPWVLKLYANNGTSVSRPHMLNLNARVSTHIE